jgi:hypothetical protein
MSRKQLVGEASHYVGERLDSRLPKSSAPVSSRVGRQHLADDRGSVTDERFFEPSDDLELGTLHINLDGR